MKDGNGRNKGNYHKKERKRNREERASRKVKIITSKESRK
jgi:hypothetical protein